MPLTNRAPAALLVALLVAACGTTAPSPSAAPSLPAEPVAAVGTPTPAPTIASVPGDLVAADLDGVLTAPDLAHRLPLAVSIDDARVARPQSGFNAASIVWQAPADGFESRYLLVFQEGDATDIGPVRSARNYLAFWAAELDAGLAHYGGDLLTRRWMTANRGTLFTDIDGMGAGNSAYHRIHTREAPHNAYTSTAALWRVAAKLGAESAISAGVHLRPFRDDLPASGRGTVGAIQIPYHTVTIRYVYDAATNAYQRFVSGKAQVDPADGELVTARTIVVLFMPFHTSNTIEKGHNRPVLGFIGSGEAWIYSEGNLVKGRWSKPKDGDPTVITGTDGVEIPFVRGRIFMQVVPLGTKIGA